MSLPRDPAWVKMCTERTIWWNPYNSQAARLSLVLGRFNEWSNYCLDP